MVVKSLLAGALTSAEVAAAGIKSRRRELTRVVPTQLTASRIPDCRVYGLSTMSAPKNLPVGIGAVVGQQLPAPGQCVRANTLPAQA